MISGFARRVPVHRANVNRVTLLPDIEVRIKKHTISITSCSLLSIWARNVESGAVIRDSKVIEANPDSAVGEL